MNLSVNGIFMCSILDYVDDVGCNVLLLESGVKALMPIADFSKKKIKKSPASFFRIGDNIPVMITQLGGDFASVSAKDVSESEANECRVMYEGRRRLQQMCKRLSHFSAGAITEQEWSDFFIKNDATHDTISSKPEFDKFAETVDDKKFIEILQKNYSKLFGIQLSECVGCITIQCFDIEGNDIVRKAMAKIMKKFTPMDKVKDYTKEELHDNELLYNVNLQLELPVFKFTVTSCDPTVCRDTVERVFKLVKLQEFDICQCSLA